MRSIVGSGDAHDDAHGDAHGEAHGEAHGDVEAHHRRAMSSDGHHEVPQWKDAHAQLGIVAFLVLLTLLFEFGQEIIEEKYAKYRSVLAHVWGELTVLGFLALITFMMVQSEVLQAVSELVFGDEMHMVHMFEKIHFALFFVLVFFLALALWLLVCIAKREAIIDQYKTRIIAYGRLRAGQGRVDDLGYTDCHEEVALAKAANVSGGPCASRPKWLLQDCEDQALFQMLRHRFVQGKLPSNFQFSNNYQSLCAKEFLEHALHLTPKTWGYSPSNHMLRIAYRRLSGGA